jgi:crossover junction endodeoxyribonuclease RusA
MIELPWFPKELAPNCSTHWAKKTRVTKMARGWAATATRAALPGYEPDDGPIAVQFTFYPPNASNAKRHDDDNLIASIKAYRDGIADALGINDNRFTMLPVKMGPWVKGGNIVVTLG